MQAALRRDFISFTVKDATRSQDLSFPTSDLKQLDYFCIRLSNRWSNVPCRSVELPDGISVLDFDRFMQAITGTDLSQYNTDGLWRASMWNAAFSSRQDCCIPSPASDVRTVLACMVQVQFFMAKKHIRQRALRDVFAFQGHPDLLSCLQDFACSDIQQFLCKYGEPHAAESLGRADMLLQSPGWRSCAKRFLLKEEHSDASWRAFDAGARLLIQTGKQFEVLDCLIDLLIKFTEYVMEFDGEPTNACLECSVYKGNHDAMKVTEQKFGRLWKLVEVCLDSPAAVCRAGCFFKHIFEFKDFCRGNDDQLKHGDVRSVRYRVAIKDPDGYLKSALFHTLKIGMGFVQSGQLDAASLLEIFDVSQWCGEQCSWIMDKDGSEYLLGDEYANCLIFEEWQMECLLNSTSGPTRSVMANHIWSNSQEDKWFGYSAVLTFLADTSEESLAKLSNAGHTSIEGVVEFAPGVNVLDMAEEVCIDTHDVPNDVTTEVEHSEPAAVIDPGEAAMITAELTSQHLECLLTSGACANADGTNMSDIASVPASAPAALGSKQCLLPWSKVVLADGRVIEADDLEVGMRVRPHLQSEGRPVEIETIHRELPRDRDLVSITIELDGLLAEFIVTASHELPVHVKCMPDTVVKEVTEICEAKDQLIVQDLEKSTHALAHVVGKLRYTVSSRVVQVLLRDPVHTFLLQAQPKVEAHPTFAVEVFGQQRCVPYQVECRRPGESLRASFGPSSQIGARSDPGPGIGDKSQPYILRTVYPPHDASCPKSAACRAYFQGKCRYGASCGACHHSDHFAGRTLVPTRRGRKKKHRENSDQ